MAALAGEVITIDHNLCGWCGGCVAVCAVDAIYLSPESLQIDDETCVLCGDCIRFCPVEALALAEG